MTQSQGPNRIRSLDRSSEQRKRAVSGTAGGAKRRPASPCISVCVMDEKTGLCRGCQRTIDEIARWGTMAPAERDRVWVLIDERRGL